MIKKLDKLKKIKKQYNQELEKYLNGTGTVVNATDDAMRLNRVNRLANEFNEKRFFWQKPLKPVRVVVW